MKDRFSQLGWVLFAALLAVVAGSGFQDASLKVGTVDLTKLVEDSDFGKKYREEFQAMKTGREGVLEFIDTFRVLTLEQAQRIRELSVKPNPTAAEKAELERIKSEVMTSSKKQQELSTKATMTPEERTLMAEYANRAQTMSEVATRWLREFTTELQAWADAQKEDALKRSRDAVQQVAKSQSFSVVFEVGVAPYGASDLTEPALKAMNAKAAGK